MIQMEIETLETWTIENWKTQTKWKHETWNNGQLK